VITRYGWDTVFRVSLLAAIIAAIAMTTLRNDALRYTIVGIIAVCVLLVLNFFRDPKRTPPSGNDLIVSPADGRIVAIRDVFEDEFLKLPAVQISIFMSPLDVHVNRFPTSGRVAYFEHISGTYRPAYTDKSSTENERTHIGIESGARRLLFKQIAGAVARRIVADLEVGQPAVLGERFGMIKFGSRVDVIMPRQSVVKVSLHDRVVAGETILALFA
jgi:phosphatidylserine decarboxylase